MALPLVSVVIPAYKAGHFEQCLKSAIGQTYPNIEILVSDNCPSEEIREICNKYNNIAYHRSDVYREENVLSALFSGEGVYIKPLFDDDILHPFCIERMAAIMIQKEGVEMVFSASAVIDADNLVSEQRRPYPETGSMPARDMHRSMTLGLRNFVGEFSSIMFKRRKILEIGRRDAFIIGGHDFSKGLADVAFFCNVAKGGSVFYVNEELSYFRRDQRLQSNSNISANPNFGFCFSDYIDLLVASHEVSVISTEEIIMMREQVKAVVLKLGPIFEQVNTSYGRYLDYIEKLGAPVVS